MGFCDGGNAVTFEALGLMGNPHSSVHEAGEHLCLPIPSFGPPRK